MRSIEDATEDGNKQGKRPRFRRDESYKVVKNRKTDATIKEDQGGPTSEKESASGSEQLPREPKAKLTLTGPVEEANPKKVNISLAGTGRWSDHGVKEPS